MSEPPADRETVLRVQRLVRQLGSRKAAERAEAEQALLALPPDACAPLLVEALQAVQNFKATDHWWYLGWLLPPIMLMHMIVLPIGKLYHLGYVPMIALILLIVVLGGLWWGRFLLGRFERSVRVKPLGRALAKFDDVRAVGPVLWASTFGYKEDRSVLEEALIRLLPRLKATDGQWLEDSERNLLHNKLMGSGTINRMPEFPLAILSALEQVGDKRDEPTVRKLADGKGLSVKEPRIREAAQACLLAIRQRLDGGPATTLLRPANAPAANILLRPAQGAPESYAERLLRPAEEETATARQAKDNS